MGRSLAPRRLIALVVGVSTQAALAADVLVVRSSDLAPYRAVDEALRLKVADVDTISLTTPDGREQLKARAPAAKVVVVLGAEAAKAVAELKPKTLLYGLVPSPEKVGLPASAGGVRMFVPAANELKAMRRLAPKVKRVGVVFDPAQSKVLVDEYTQAATALGLELSSYAVGSRQEVVGAVRSLLPKVDALLLVPDTTVLGADSFKFIVQSALEAKVPVLGFSEATVRSGAVLGLEASWSEAGQRLGELARKAAANDGPQPLESVEGSLFINARIAAQLELDVGEDLKASAAKVFE